MERKWTGREVLEIPTSHGIQHIACFINQNLSLNEHKQKLISPHIRKGQGYMWLSVLLDPQPNHNNHTCHLSPPQGAAFPPVTLRLSLQGGRSAANPTGLLHHLPSSRIGKREIPSYNLFKKTQIGSQHPWVMYPSWTNLRRPWEMTGQASGVESTPLNWGSSSGRFPGGYQHALTRRKARAPPRQRTAAERRGSEKNDWVTRSEGGNRGKPSLCIAWESRVACWSGLGRSSLASNRSWARCFLDGACNAEHPSCSPSPTPTKIRNHEIGLFGHINHF